MSRAARSHQRLLPVRLLLLLVLRRAMEFVNSVMAVVADCAARHLDDFIR
jgi:hypothetical protein